jgi:uncharacterized membrane protein YqgA involved in biofilm formation
MLGSYLNAAGILLGAIAGLAFRPQLSAAPLNYLRLALGAFTLAAGGRLAWLSVNGTGGQVGRQILSAFLALILGRLIGRLLRLQKLSNRVGESARAQISRVTAGGKPAWSDGFNTCAALFCVAPLAVLGGVTEGLDGNFLPLAIKTAMDALGAMSFAVMFGGSVALAALPVFVWQGTLTLLCALFAAPFLAQHGLLDAVNAAAGLLLVFVAVVIFELRKVELTDYLPALAVAPALAWLWR